MWTTRIPRRAWLGLAVVIGVLVLAARPAPMQAGGMQAQGEGGGGDEAQFLPVKKQPAHPLSAATARTWLKLQQAVTLNFEQGTTLRHLLDTIRQETTGKGQDAANKDDGLVIYVDPIGLQEAEKTLDSPIEINIKGVPLVTSLALALKQLGLVFSVNQDGLVLITGESSEDFTPESVPVSTASARTWLRLHEAMDFAFAESTPLEDVLKDIKARTKGPDRPKGLQFYVQVPRERGDAPLTVTLNLEDIPLASALDLITKQLDMTYRVRDDGIVVIQEPPGEDVDELPEGHGSETIARLRVILEETRLKAQIAGFRARIENPQAGMGGMGGGMGGMGGGMRGGMMSEPVQ
ncbi:MAG TPA: STN domain-containing protein [Isosphaeraceae bacterium]|jgi:hypothetical protein|nr:STN domain-containing protein [Isosphaeraceae bacterium]